MSELEYNVPNISCGHCVHTIQTELSDIPGVLKVFASQDTLKVLVEFQPPASGEQIEGVLREINYPPVQ